VRQAVSILSALATGLDVRRMSSTGSLVLDKDRSFMSLVRYLSRFLRSRSMDSEANNKLNHYTKLKTTTLN
jgi:hypothetical protein